MRVAKAFLGSALGLAPAGQTPLHLEGETRASLLDPCLPDAAFAAVNAAGAGAVAAEFEA